MAIMLAIYRPDVLEDVWLWIVGLIGPILGIIKKLKEKLAPLLEKI